MIHVDGILYISTALLLLLLPMKWLVSVAIAVFVHEFCHLAALFFVRGRIRRITITSSGCEIITESLGEVQQFFSILAGPIGSLCLILFRRFAPELAVCGLFHGIYNLIPVLPFDGGRLLQIILLRIIPEKADSILLGIRKTSFCTLFVLGICLCFLDRRLISCFTMFAVLCIGRLIRKTPCKARKSKVQ